MLAALVATAVTGAPTRPTATASSPPAPAAGPGQLAADLVARTSGDRALAHLTALAAVADKVRGNADSQEATSDELSGGGVDAGHGIGVDDGRGIGVGPGVGVDAGGGIGIDGERGIGVSGSDEEDLGLHGPSVIASPAAKWSRILIA